MALCISRKNIPDIDEKVIKVEISDDKRVAWIFFDSGKTLISHISRDSDSQDSKLK